MMIIIYILIFIASFILQGLFHELGHLIGGMTSDYHFLSFHWGLLSFDISAKRRLSFDKAYYGQCVMIPNDNNDRHFVFYNISGILSNVIVSLICGIFLIIVSDLDKIIFVFLCCLVISGIAKISGNSLPLNKNKPNDVQVIRWLLKSQQMVVDYFIYLRIYEKYSFGLDKEHIKRIYSISDSHTLSEEDIETYNPFFMNECLKLLY
jgi:uncharacterized membrane protein YccF (DUF307 family)